MDFDPRHILLRDRRGWLGTRAGLALDRDGVLMLARVPAPAGGKPIEIAVSYPYTREVSGIATGPCDAVFVADTAHHRVLYVDRLCASESWLAIEGLPGSGPGQFNQPRGLAVTLDALLVADSGNARIQFMAMPGLEPNRVLGGYAAPVSVAADSKNRLLVVDIGAKRLRRREADATADAAFDAAIVASGRLNAPLSVTCIADDQVAVSDTDANQVYAFDADGNFLHALDGPGGWLPGALAALGERIYAADAASGYIYAFDGSTLAGVVPGYRGPVTALAVAANGDLFVKPALDATYFQLGAGATYVDHGELVAGPFDAGETRDWERVWIDGDAPADTRIVIEAVQKGAAAPSPLPNEWRMLTAKDALLSVLDPALAAGERRYLWLRVRLSSESSTQSPRVRQARAATATENYLEYLPSTYGRNDARADGSEGLLSRLLKLLRGEFGAIEELLDDMPRLADSQFSQAAVLPWLAQWIALELPRIASDDEQRALIKRAVALFARRGTAQSIAGFIELHTGIFPTIIEAFEHRHIWLLGEGIGLDFDTSLPALDPLGMVVPDEVAPECCDTPPPPSGPCRRDVSAATPIMCNTGPRGRAVVGESGPLAPYQIGLPLFADDAFRFCVLVEGYRVQQKETVAEIRRIVDREKPAHTDYRIERVEPDMRVGLQARVGIDAVVGGDPPPWQIAAQLGFTTRFAPRDGASRVGESTLGETMTLT